MATLKGEKILIGPSSFSSLDYSPMNRLIEAGCEVIENPFKRKFTKSELIELLAKGATGLIAGQEQLDRNVLENCKLKVISRCGSGMSNVDLIATKELGIKVFSTPDAPIEAVAELTLGAMFCMLRMIPQMDKNLHEGKWTKRIGVQLMGKTVGIIGFGRIGRRLAKLLIPLNANILAVDPYLEESVESVPLLTLERALPKADIISIHSSGKNQILGEKEFSLMKQGTYLLNAARGDLVDENALIKALEDGRIVSAWIDTFKQEPYKGPLIKYPQVLLTPHVGSYTAECRKQMEMEAVDNLIAALIKYNQ